jgi:predicted ATPase
MVSVKNHEEGSVSVGRERDGENAMTNLRFVITGGPGVGKTSTLEALAVRGFLYVPESARAIIKKRKESGLSPRPALARFGAEMLKADIAQYRSTTIQNEPVFFDRGMGDTLAFRALPVMADLPHRRLTHCVSIVSFHRSLPSA